MDEEGVNDVCFVLTEQKEDSFYPMLFGVSCAFSAFELLSERGLNNSKWSEVSHNLLKGSARLMGLLVWRAQREQAKRGKCELILKLENAEREIEELKKLRSEDAKANEKVVSIFAAHEQGWFVERKKLRQQIGALLNELRVQEAKKDETIYKLNEQLKEKDNLVQSKDKLLEEERQKRREKEENLKKAENAETELRETLKREAQEHSTELWKHKTAFIELVSTQRQLESEMGRAVRQVEAAKQDLDAVLDQKEQYVLMTQKLSMELLKTRKDLEQKDKILSAMLRKSKLDTAEKQMLLKEVKVSKSKRQQAEMETEKWRTVSESRHERHSLRSMLSRHYKSKSEAFPKGVHSSAARPSHNGKTTSQPTNLAGYEQSDLSKEPELFSPLSEQYLTKASEEMVFAADVKQLEGWVQCEAEKYANAIEQRHLLEVDAFAEQLRLKDERLEAFRWHLLSMELESKRLQSHIEGLDHDQSQLRQENLKLEALLLDREAELHSLKEQLALEFSTPNVKNISNSSPHHLALTQKSVWSNVKIIKRKPGEKEQEASEEVKLGTIEENQILNPCKDIVLTVHSPGKEFEEEKDVALDPSSIQEKHKFKDAEKTVSLASELSTVINSTWKMDLHALGVSYKIKRLKQQLLMFERLMGKQESCEKSECDDKGQCGINRFNLLMSLLNKQISRYQSLQGKTDNLCKRMHENNLDVNCGGRGVARTKEGTKILEHFLEETFQLQRYIVATGQKMMEIQSKIASGFVVGAAEELDGAASFDMKRFADSLRTLFREVQKALEVRISRIIGDLEGTLAREGIMNFRT